MLRTATRNLMVGLGLAALQACSGANAAGGGGGTKVLRDLTAASGTAIALRAENGLTSRTNRAGDPIVATAVTAALSAARDTVIPVGAEFRGTVTEIAAAPTPRDRARLQLTFTEARFGGAVYPIQARVTGMNTHLEGRGITGGTVAKVGAGAVIGGIAGRLIGRSSTGTVVGAAAGAAAGGVYAHETRDLDIVLPPGTVMHITLTGPFAPSMAAK